MKNPIIFTPALSIHMKIRTFLVFVFSFLPLGSTTLVESRVDKVEGKIIFCSAELKSPDGKVTFVTANALFIQLDTQGKGAVDVDVEDITWPRVDTKFLFEC